MPNEFRPIRVITYGPLPRRFGTLGLGLTLVALAGLLSLVTLHHRFLDCDRTGPEAGWCRAGSEDPWSRTVERRFPVSEVREVRWVEQRGGKGQPRGETVLVFTSGRDLRVANGGIDAARAAHDRIKLFFDQPGGTALREETRQPAWFWLFVLAALVAGLVCLALFGAAVTAVRVELDADGRLRLTRFHHGVSGRATVLEAARWREVRVDTSAMAPWYQRSTVPTVPTARVVLVRGDGPDVPLSSGFTTAVEAAHRAAVELGEALGLRRRPASGSTGSDEEPDGPAGTYDPATAEADARLAAAAAPGNPYNPKIPVKTLVWVGIGLTAVSLIFLIVVPRLSGETGRLSVKCTHRCRFHGTECLPGGSWSSPLKPGVYELQVWNPDVPGNWETVLVEVQDGGNTHFTCRPRSGGPPPTRSTP